MTPFASLCGLAGLSLGEASDMLDIGRQQAKDMSSGRRSTPIGIIAELIALIHRQAAQADAEAESSGLDVIILEKPADDVEARALGWPCVGAWSAMAARVMVATALPVAFVPYGAAAEAVEDVPLPRLR